MDTSNIDIRLENDLYEEDENDQRTPEVTSSVPNQGIQKAPAQSSSCMGSMLRCCFGGVEDDAVFDKSPDDDFYADSLIELSHGYTAYRLLEPAQANENSTNPPLIVLLHGMQNSSYMWADIAELLADFEQGPQAQVLVFDFYGRGRSPWTGVPISLDLLVGQVKELMDGNLLSFILLCKTLMFLNQLELFYYSFGTLW